MERLEVLVLCFDGFPKDAPIDVRLIGPDGSEHTYRAIGNIVAPVFTNEMPLGDWSLQAAADGGPIATGSIHVATAQMERVYETADHASSGAAGLTFEVTGFPADAEINIFLYGPSGDAGLQFMRALPVATTNRHGEARYSVAARSDDPPGFYGVWLDSNCGSNSHICASFRK